MSVSLFWNWELWFADPWARSYVSLQAAAESKGWDGGPRGSLWSWETGLLGMRASREERETHRLQAGEKSTSKWRVEEFGVVYVIENPPLNSLQNLRETLSHTVVEMWVDSFWEVESLAEPCIKATEKAGMGTATQARGPCLMHTHALTQSCRDPHNVWMCVCVCVRVCVWCANCIHLMQTHTA